MATARNARNARDRLLVVAARLFRDEGYPGTTIREIARRARVEPSALYYHFTSREALLEAVLDAAILSLQHRVEAALAALPDDATPRERVRAAIAAHARGISEQGDLSLASRRLMSRIPATMRRKHDALRANYGAYWQRLLEEAAAAEPFRRSGNLLLARMFVLGALNWTSEWFDPKRKTIDELADQLCDILFDGLRERQAPAPRPRAGSRAASGGHKRGASR